MARDIFDNFVNLWDIVAVVSASGELQIALVVEAQKHCVRIIRFNKDGTLRNRPHYFTDSEEMISLSFDSLPVEYLLTRKALIDAKG